MAAFLLISKEEKRFDRLKALELIQKQTGTESTMFTTDKWDLYLFRKQGIEQTNFRKGTRSELFVTGTIFYPGLTYAKTLDKILSELENDVIRPVAPSGNYFLLTRVNNILKFKTDRTGIYSVFHTSNGKVISNSFLGLCCGLPGLTLNRDAVVENLVTGSLIGGETIFDEICRFEPLFPYKFDDLEFAEFAETFESPVYRNKEESLSGQVDALDSYFKSITPFINEAGLDCGITGGYDSRLLFAMACRHFNNDMIQFHSFLREKPDNDFLFGKRVCETGRCHFFPATVRDTDRLSGDIVSDIMYRAMLFNDGQVRTHSFWHEELNTAQFRQSVLRDKHAGFSGVGGEQYRNSERMIAGRWDFIKWVDYSLIGRQAGDPFQKRTVRTKLIEDLCSKIRARLDIEHGNSIDLHGIKRYMNEIYIPSNRGVRCNNENKLSFFVAPFADLKVSHAAYGAIPFLGNTLDYEGQIIKSVNPVIASLPSVYGYSFDKGEPLLKTIALGMLENAIPWSLNQKIYNTLAPRKTEYWRSLMEKNELFCKADSLFNEFSVAVDISKLITSKDLGPLIFAMGYLLDYLKNKIR